LDNENFIGLIPAAGSGTRLNLPFPKELYPTIKGDKYQPIAHYIVKNIIDAGAKHIVFVINESKHQLLGYFGSGDRFGCNFSYVFQERISRNRSTSPGLADALSSAYHLIKNKIVLFGMPDTIMWPNEALKIGLNSMENNSDVMLCLFPTSFPEKFGMVSFNNQREVIEIVDKPKTTSLKFMWGCIIWKPIFTEFLYTKVQNDNIGDFAEILNLAIKNNLKFNAISFSNGKFFDFGTYEQIQQFSINENLK